MSSFKLRQELLTDPLGRGYAGMTDAAVLADLIDASLRAMADVDTLAGAEIYEVIHRAEFIGLSNAEEAELTIILGLGESIKVGSGSKARTALAGMFGAGTQTRTDLLALVTNRTQSRAQELGIDTPRLMTVTAIAAARLPNQP
ncbi:hypothetical protein LCGC14_1101350 [marine sediment metagenome]|uniref:Uncharacterized protein n=1 Tax=marine sediment metagenome TaxID=412755 RepID=A0A0F9QFJ8_9ZZZZ